MQCSEALPQDGTLFRCEAPHTQPGEWHRTTTPKLGVIHWSFSRPKPAAAKKPQEPSVEQLPKLAEREEEQEIELRFLAPEDESSEETWFRGLNTVNGQR